MLPHGRCAAGDGVPRCRLHRRWYEPSKAYTVLFSVATIVHPRMTIGDPYTFPSSASFVTTLGVPLTAGMDAESPCR